MDDTTDKDENPVSGVGIAMLSFFAACSLIIGGLATWGLCAFIHNYLFPVNADFVGVTAAGIVGLLFVCTPTFGNVRRIKKLLKWLSSGLIKRS